MTHWDWGSESGIFSPCNAKYENIVEHYFYLFKKENRQFYAENGA